MESIETIRTAIVRAKGKNNDVSDALDKIEKCIATITAYIKDLGSAKNAELSFINEAANKLIALEKEMSTAAADKEPEHTLPRKVPEELTEMRKLSYYKRMLISLSVVLKPKWKSKVRYINDDGAFIIPKAELVKLTTIAYFIDSIEKLAKTDYYLAPFEWQGVSYYLFRESLFIEEMKEMGVKCMWV